MFQQKLFSAAGLSRLKILLIDLIGWEERINTIECLIRSRVTYTLGFPDGAVLKNPSALLQEMWVQSLGQEDSPGIENGNSLQYSCLGNPRDIEAWRVSVHGVAKSLT